MSSSSVGPLALPPRVHRPDVNGAGLYVLYDHCQRSLRVVVPTDVMVDTQFNTLVMSPTPSCTPALQNEMAF